MVTPLGWAARGAIAAGLISLVLTCVWWGILFPGVMLNTGLGLGQALPCIASDSSICTLAMSLCGARHLFGINRYTPQLFWAGAMALSFGLLLSGFRTPRSRTIQRSHKR